MADYANAYTDCAGVMIDGIDYSVPISQMPADTLTGADSDLYAAARAAFFEAILTQPWVPFRRPSFKCRTIAICTNSTRSCSSPGMTIAGPPPWRTPC